MLTEPSPMQQQIYTKLTQQLAPNYLDVMNESHMHGGPATESHFKVVIASDRFAGERLLARHRMLNEILADELAHAIHALALHTYTPQEWAEQNQAPTSPACRGGSQAS